MSDETYLRRYLADPITIEPSSINKVEDTSDVQISNDLTKYLKNYLADSD